MTDRTEKNSGGDEAGVFTEDYLAYLMAKASHLITKEIHEEFKESDTPVSTWRILAAVKDVERSVGKLAKIVMLNQPTLSKALDRLEADGFIRRRRDVANRRTVYIGITEKGKKTVSHLLPKVDAHDEMIFGIYSADEKKQIKVFLQNLIKRLDK